MSGSIVRRVMCDAPPGDLSELIRTRCAGFGPESLTTMHQARELAQWAGWRLHLKRPAPDPVTGKKWGLMSGPWVDICPGCARRYRYQLINAGNDMGDIT